MTTESSHEAAASSQVIPGQTTPSSERQRPGALTPICVVAFVLALLALSSSVLTLTFGGPSSMPSFGNLYSGGGATAQIQQQMMRDMMAALEPWQPWTTALAWINLAVASLLGVGGLLAIRIRSPGARLLLAALGGALLAEVMGAPLMVVTQRAMSTAMERWIPQMLASAGGTALPPAFEQSMEWAMRSSLLTGIVLGVLFALAKMGFCAYGIWYLRRPATRALFAVP